MSRSERLGRSRQLVIGFVAITGVLTLLLGWLAWRFVSLEQDLDDQRIQQRLVAAADAAVGVLTVGTAETRRWLREVAEGKAPVAADDLPPDSVLLLEADNAWVALPQRHLIYYPFPGAHPPGPADSRFAAVDTLEFRDADFEAAATQLRELALDNDPAVRALGLQRLGRVAEKAGDIAAALATYDRLAAQEEGWIDDLPATLLARDKRCELLAMLGRHEELRAAAGELSRDLDSGRWHLTAGMYRFYSERVAGWFERSPADPALDDRLALAAAVEAAWRQRERDIEDGTRLQEASSTTRWIENRPFITFEESVGNRRGLLIAGPGFAQQRWIADLRDFAATQEVDIDLVDAAGATAYRTDGDAAAPPNGTQLREVRTPADTGLPWSVRVSSSDPAGERASMASRRNLLLAGFAVVLALLLSSVYFVGRAVSHEMQVARLQSDFVAAVSHEFRSPLTSMRHLIELLATDRVPDEPARNRFYDVLGRETNRLQRLVEQLLDFRRMDEGAMVFEREPIVVAELIDDVAADFRNEMGPRGFGLDWTANGNRQVVCGDREALGRALWNLLDNAVSYSPGSDIVGLSVEDDDDHLRINVRDRGIGIESDEQDRIFDKFVRGSASERTGAPGTGLGLAMVSEIIAAHGGEVTLESTVGEGSTFTIKLPLAQNAP